MQKTPMSLTPPTARIIGGRCHGEKVEAISNTIFIDGEDYQLHGLGDELTYRRSPTPSDRIRTAD